MKLVITGPAREDLRQIGSWIGQDSPRRASSFVKELAQCCRNLTTQSARFPVVATVAGRPLRRCVHGPYLVFFEIDRSSDIVQVVRILHGARDHAHLLGADEDVGDVND